MTWAVDRPRRRQWSRGSEAVTSSGIRAMARPLGAAGVGLLSGLIGVWGARWCSSAQTSGTARPRSAPGNGRCNWLLHLIPGAVAAAAGLIIMSLMLREHPLGGAAGTGIGLSALLLIGVGAWFVIGPALWPTFESSPAFATVDPRRDILHQSTGIESGPGCCWPCLAAWRSRR